MDRTILPSAQRQITLKGGVNNLFKTLDTSEIQGVMAKARIRGLYKEQLEAFLASEANGAEVDLEEGEFAGKNVDTVYQGFAGAIRTHFEGKVRLIRVEDTLYLVNLNVA